MPSSIKNSKTILITGCSSGIGYCVAHGLRKRGHHVITSARNEQDIVSLRHEGFDCIPLDLASSDSINNAVKQALELCDGRIDALFNNGAFGQPGAVEDLSREALRNQFETNLFGTVELTNLLIPSMRKHQFGRIIQNSSVLGFIALPYRGAYTSSKYALEGISDTLRLELLGSGIDISIIEPGPIESRFRSNAFDMFKKFINRENSVHRNTYLKMENRLTKEGPAVPFTLPPEAVLTKVIHALEKPRPKARYFVTFPTYLFATLKWIMSNRTMDKVMLRISSDENR